MKVTDVELHPDGSSDVFLLSFRDPSRQNPYNIMETTGLDPDVVLPRYYGVSGNSATSFYDFKPEKRDLVFSISLNPVFSNNQSYSDLREALYKMISSSRSGSTVVYFKNGPVVVAAISGRVTKLESPTFTKFPQVKLTITPDDPWLKAPIPTLVPVGGLNPASTNIQDLLSTAPHGFDFQMAFTANVASLTISDSTVGLPTDEIWTFIVTPVGGFLTGDVLHFSSEENDKHLYITRGASTIQLADTITPGSIWPIMFPGDNNIGFSSPGSLTWTSISYYPTYWGI